jgi:hypothetical protein
LVVAGGTIQKVSTGQLIFAPCLKDLEGKEEEAAKILQE